MEQISDLAHILMFGHLRPPVVKHRKCLTIRFWLFVVSDINDVDLYSGGLSEQQSGSVVGPTFACLLGQQFAKLRNCDRFWWENTDPNTGFASGESLSE